MARAHECASPGSTAFSRARASEAAWSGVPLCLTAMLSISALRPEKAAKTNRCAMDSFLQAEALVMSFGIYLFGIILMVAGLVYAAAIMHAPAQWIVVGTLVLLGVGVVAAVKSTRQRDPSE